MSFDTSLDLSPSKKFLKIMRFRLVNYLLALIPVFWYFGRSNSNFVSLMKRAQVAYTLPPSPLNLWTEFFKSVRQVSRAGAVVPIPDISNFSMSAVTGLLPYYLVLRN